MICALRSVGRARSLCASSPPHPPSPLSLSRPSPASFSSSCLSSFSLFASGEKSVMSVNNLQDLQGQFAMRTTPLKRKDGTQDYSYTTCGLFIRRVCDDGQILVEGRIGDYQLAPLWNDGKWVVAPEDKCYWAAEWFSS